MLDDFTKKVRLPFNLDIILKPVGKKDGETLYADKSDLIDSLDLCFNYIDDILISEKIKRDYINFIDNHLVYVRMEISRLKYSIKLGDKKSKKEKKIINSLDLNNTKDFEIFKKISEKNMALTQDKFIISYLEEQNIFLRSWVSDKRKLIDALVPQQAKSPNDEKLPETLEEIFYKTENAEICLSILREIEPPFIDNDNNFLGKGKGVFPLWINVLLTNNEKPLIKYYSNSVYKDLLNKKIKGLNLSKDASEFRKHYKRLEKNNIELDIKAILSQYSQSGKLGK